MKIAYITIHIEPKLINGGVGKKINSQVSIWQSMGHSVALFSLTPAWKVLVKNCQLVVRLSVR